MTGRSGGFDGLSGAGDPAAAATPPPAGIRTMSDRPPMATRMVMVRHGEAVCNVSGVCGGQLGCEGLTQRGRGQVAELRDRLLTTGELAGADALYASVLPRAIETAELLAPALLAATAAQGGAGGAALPGITTECGLCELHPGAADGLTWSEFTAKFGTLDWDDDPGQPIAPGGESWTGFVNRVADTLDALAGAHGGQVVVVACHAGVIEASLLAKLPVAGGLAGARLQLRTEHASMTTWEIDGDRWRLLGYNDVARPAPAW